MKEHGTTGETRRRSGILAGAILTGALALAGCSEPTNTKPPVVEAAGEAPSNSGDLAKTCNNYGEAVTASKDFLAQHSDDQKTLQKNWQRAVVVKTLFEPASGRWKGTIVLPDGSIRVMSTMALDNIEMAAYINNGDYIAFDNGDNDFKVPAPHSPHVHDGSDEQMQFLGHGVIPCNDQPK